MATTLRIHCMTANAVSNHHMIALSAERSPGGRLPHPWQVGMVSVSYEVSTFEELRQIYSRINEHGPEHGGKILHSEDRGNLKSFSVADLDGNELEFYCLVPTNAAAAGERWALRGDLDAELNSTESGGVPILASSLRTGHLTLRCQDLARSKRFYEDELHLYPVGEDGAGRTYYAGNPATDRIVLALQPATRRDAPLPEPVKMFGMMHFAFEESSFSDLQIAWRSFQDHRVEAVHNFDHGVTQSIYFQDPDGNLLEIYHDVPRAEYLDPGDPFAAHGAFEDRLELIGSQGS
jgi:catechol 2,3-dioxygenase